MAPSQYVYSPLSLHDALPIYGSLSATIRENSCYEPACLITEWSPRCISPLAPSTSADLPIVEFSSVLLVMAVSRSEERRVGKECRSRRGGDDTERKNADTNNMDST